MSVSGGTFERESSKRTLYTTPSPPTLASPSVAFLLNSFLILIVVSSRTSTTSAAALPRFLGSMICFLGPNSVVNLVPYPRMMRGSAGEMVSLPDPGVAMS